MFRICILTLHLFFEFERGWKLKHNVFDGGLPFDDFFILLQQSQNARRRVSFRNIPEQYSMNNNVRWVNATISSEFAWRCAGTCGNLSIPNINRFKAVEVKKDHLLGSELKWRRSRDAPVALKDEERIIEIRRMLFRRPRISSELKNSPERKGRTYEMNFMRGALRAQFLSSEPISPEIRSFSCF